MKVKNGRNEGLDLARALAILLVWGLHAGQLVAGTAPKLAGATAYGWVGVDVFFVLSGFLIASQFWSEEASIGRFYVKRWLRTLPLYFVVLCFYVALKPMLGFPFVGRPLAYAVFAQNYAGATDFVPSWSLCVEEQFYLVFPLAALLASRRRLPSAVWLLPLAFSVAARFLQARALGGAAMSLPDFCRDLSFKTHYHLDGLSAGVFLAATRRHWEEWRRRRALAAAALGLGLVAVTLAWGGRPWEGPGLVLCFTGLSIGIALTLPWLMRLRLPEFVAGVTSRIALWSYGIYIWNDVVSRFLHRDAFAGEPWGVRVAVFGALSVLVAVATYHLVERPALRLRDHILKKPEIPAVDRVEDFYRNDAYSGFGGNFSTGQHAAYGSFVKAHLRGQSVLEIGSGLGAAAYALHLNGVAVTASDIFPDLAQRKFAELGVPIETIPLNATQNRLADSSVPNYALYQVLEHIADPEACFEHCFRSLKPGGRLIVVSPNLLSPLVSALAVVNGLTRRWSTPWFHRQDGYTFPFGDSVAGGIGILARNIALAAWIRFTVNGRKPRFRVPSFRKPAVSDSDAVFLTEPLTVRHMLESAGFSIVSFQKPRRTGSWAGSVWIVAEKPATSAALGREEPRAEDGSLAMQHQREL